MHQYTPNLKSEKIGKFQSEFFRNKAGYTALPVICEWAGAMFEVTRSFGQEQYDKRI